MRYWEGVAAGVAATMAALALVAAGTLLPDLRASYRGFGGEIPTLSRVALGHAWAWGVPAAIFVALVVSHRSFSSDRIRVWVTVAIAAAAVVAVTLGMWAAYLPIFQLSGNIAAD